MNVRKLALTSTAIVALSAVSAGGALAATTSGSASASIVQAATVTLATAPNFGQISVAGTGSATLTPGGTVNTSPNYTAAGGTPAAGVANVGQSSGTVNITLALADLATGTNTLHATSLSATGANLTALTGTASTAAGSVTAAVAGTTFGGGSTTTINIGAGITDGGTAPAAGTYTGTLTVTVNNA